MKYRTIEEARKVVIPELPQSFPKEFSNLAKTIQFGNESIVSKLNKIYLFTNKITKFIAPYMVCQKGCSHCCHINVAITSLEGRYIQTNLGISVVDGKSTSDNSGKARIPCSFLSGEGICTIYEHRPYACRTYHAIDDPKYCELQDVNHMQYTSESSGMLNKLFLMVVGLNGNKPIRDIRDFFPNGKA